MRAGDPKAPENILFLVFLVALPLKTQEKAKVLTNNKALGRRRGGLNGPPRRPFALRENGKPMQRFVLCCLLVWSIASFSHLYQRSDATPAIFPAGAQPTSDATGTLSVNGYTRSFIYATSAANTPPTGRPLVIHLHGDGGTMDISAAWRQAVLTDQNGAVFLSAQGRNNIPQAAAIDGSAWRFRMDEAGEPFDDVDFISQLITQATGNSALLGTRIDPAQVYVVGESRGAGFAYVLYADPRISSKIRAIAPISGTFYCEGAAVESGKPGTPARAGSDTTCGEVSVYGYWGPKATLFNVVRPAHILDIHGQLPPDGSELPETAPPALDRDYESLQWAGWGNAAGCYTVRVSSQTERTLDQPIGGRTVKTYAYSQSENNLATRCTSLDLTFYVAQGAGHVPGGFEPTAWCFLSSVGGSPSTSACQLPTTAPTLEPVTPLPSQSYQVSLPLATR